MPKFFITPDNIDQEIKAQITTKYLADELMGKWEAVGVRVDVQTIDSKFIRWLFYDGGRVTIHGSFDEDGQVLVLDGGSASQIADFALWYRSIFPNEQRLIYFDEDYMGHFPLVAETTRGEIVANI